MTQAPAGSSVMTKALFLAQLDHAALVTQTQPVTGALVRHLAAALRKGDPPWWPKVLKAWEKRKFVAWTEAWGLFLSAVHYEALSDEDNPLVRYFPSCGGTPEADPAPALDRFLAAAPASFFERLKTGHRRSYVAARAPLWVIPALLSFQSKRLLQFYLVEINAGAGLDLAADQVFPQQGFSSDLVAARIVGEDVQAVHRVADRDPAVLLQLLVVKVNEGLFADHTHAGELEGFTHIGGDLGGARRHERRVLRRRILRGHATRHAEGGGGEREAENRAGVHCWLDRR